jgi:hypothetical protein
VESHGGCRQIAPERGIGQPLRSIGQRRGKLADRHLQLLPQGVSGGTPVRQAHRAVDNKLLAFNDPSLSGRIRLRPRDHGGVLLRARSLEYLPQSLARFGVPVTGPEQRPQNRPDLFRQRRAFAPVRHATR